MGTIFRNADSHDTPIKIWIITIGTFSMQQYLEIK